MSNIHLPSGMTQDIAMLIDANWTPAQAKAVVGRLDDLRKMVWRTAYFCSFGSFDIEN